MTRRDAAHPCPPPACRPPRAVARRGRTSATRSGAAAGPSTRTPPPPRRRSPRGRPAPPARTGPMALRSVEAGACDLPGAEDRKRAGPYHRHRCLVTPRLTGRSGHCRSRYRAVLLYPWVEPWARALGRHGCGLVKECRTARGAAVTRFLGANRLNGASGRAQPRNTRRSAPRRRVGDRSQPGLAVAGHRRRPKRPNGLPQSTSTSTSSCHAWSAKRAAGDIVSRTKRLDVAPRPLTYLLSEPADLTSRFPDPSSATHRTVTRRRYENVATRSPDETQSDPIEAFDGRTRRARPITDHFKANSRNHTALEPFPDPRNGHKPRNRERGNQIALQGPARLFAAESSRAAWITPASPVVVGCRSHGNGRGAWGRDGQPVEPPRSSRRRSGGPPPSTDESTVLAARLGVT